MPFFVAVSCFARSSVKVVKLVFTKDKFEFTPLHDLLNCHVAPIGRLRLSKQYPRLLVTCGFERDTYIKLWNISSAGAEGEAAKCLH